MERAGDIAGARHAEQVNRQMAQGGHVGRAAPFAEPGPVSIQGHAADPVDAAFDRPVGAVESQQTGRAGRFWRETRDAVEHLIQLACIGLGTALPEPCFSA